MPRDTSQNSDFREVQRAFTRYIRNPASNPSPEGLEERRLRIYRELIYNNIQSFMANSFPVIRRLLDDAAWHALMRDYVATHNAQTPLFPKMPQEFLRYLETDRNRIPAAFPYLAELAHYEWLEIAISLDTREVETAGINSAGDLLAGVPALNPVAVPAAYQWPVHRISPDYRPEAKTGDMTYLVVYRKPDYEIGFMELNPLSARLLEKIAGKTGKSGRALLLEIAEEIKHPDQQIIVNGGLEMLETLREKFVLLGTIE